MAESLYEEVLRLRATVAEFEEHAAMLKLGYTGVYGFHRCEKCGHENEIDTRPPAVPF